MSRRNTLLVEVTIALCLLPTASCEAPRGTSAQFSGTIDGQPFAVRASAARRLSHGGLAVDLGDFSPVCNNPTPPAGARLVGLLVPRDAEPGSYALSGSALGDGPTASVTTWLPDADAGRPLPRGVLLSDGTFTFATVTDGGITGRAEVKTTGIELEGAFEAPWCP